MGKCFEAMEVDSLISSHPVSSHVENPMQIQEMFDDVSYDKVSSIVTVTPLPSDPPSFHTGELLCELLVWIKSTFYIQFYVG